MDWEGCSTARVEWGDIGLPHFRMLHDFFFFYQFFFISAEILDFVSFFFPPSSSSSSQNVTIESPVLWATDRPGKVLIGRHRLHN